MDRFNICGDPPNPYDELGNELRAVLTILSFIVMGIFLVLSLVTQ